MQLYALIDPFNNMVRYIGQTIRPLSKRLSSHLLDSKKLKNRKHCWIKSILTKGKTPQIIGLHLSCCQECANYLEIKYINHYNSLGNDLVNITTGGKKSWILPNDIRILMSLKKKEFWKNENNKIRILLKQKEGRAKMSDEAIEKTSQHARKYLHNAEARVKAGKKIKIHHNSDNYKAKKSAEMLAYWKIIEPTQKKKLIETFTGSGRKKLKEIGFCMSNANMLHIKKMAEELRNKKAKPFIAFKNGIEIGRWTNLIDGQKELGVCYQNILAVINGRAKTAKGYTFKSI